MFDLLYAPGAFVDEVALQFKQVVALTYLYNIVKYVAWGSFLASSPNATCRDEFRSPLLQTSWYSALTTV